MKHESEMHSSATDDQSLEAIEQRYQNRLAWFDKLEGHERQAFAEALEHLRSLSSIKALGSGEVIYRASDWLEAKSTGQARGEGKDE